MEGFCMKCQEKKEIANEREVSMKAKGGKERKALKGNCPTCDTKMFRIIGAAKTE